MNRAGQFNVSTNISTQKKYLYTARFKARSVWGRMNETNRERKLLKNSDWQRDFPFGFLQCITNDLNG